MTNTPDIRFVDDGRTTPTAVERARLHEEFETETARAGIGPGARVLEIGYGHGHFLAWATEQGCKVVGTEINPRLHAAAKAAGHDVYLGTLEEVEFPPGTAFDAIVAFDVFEHLTIPELTASLERMHALLSSRGVIFARFPNGGSPFGLAFQSGDITHRTCLNEASMEQLAALTDYSLEFCRNAARPLAGGRSRMLKGLAFVLCDAIEIVVGALYFRGRRMPLDPNLVCLLRRRDGTPGP